MLVGEAYDLLDATAQQVMQALAVYPAPVSAVGVDFLLRPVTPTTDAAPILTRLVRRQLVRFQDGHYHLHPVDRDYARSQLPAGSPGDTAAAFTLTGLQARAADYYAEIRTPRESWRSLEDVRPQLAEFGLRCDTGDYDIAATVLARHRLRLPAGMGSLSHAGRAARAHPRTDHRSRPERRTWPTWGTATLSLGEYRQAIDLYSQALAIARDIGDRRARALRWATWGSATAAWASTGRPSTCTARRWPSPARPATARREHLLGNLGNCHSQPGRVPAGHRPVRPGAGHRPRDRRPLRRGRRAGQPGELPPRPGRVPAGHRPAPQALAIAREIGDRRGEGATLSSLGDCHPAWASTGRPSTCTPRRWPSPATSATATARPMRWTILAGPGWRQATRAGQ